MGLHLLSTHFRKKKAVTLNLKLSSVKVDGDIIQIDPLLLFQRLTTVMQSSDNLELAFKHELCSYPPALFDSSLLLHETDKPALAIADAIWKTCESSVPVDIPDNSIQYVLDGGTLLQCIPWSHGSTYGEICHQYTEFVTRKCKNSIIVFDGFENMNTKCMTHQRRSKGKASATVTVAANMTTTMKKDWFLANQKNKQQFNYFLLSAELEKSKPTGDADLLIVQKAVQFATTSKTGEETDLIVLLCYYTNLDSHDLFFRPEPKKSMKKLCVWNIRATKEKTSVVTSSSSTG